MFLKQYHAELEEVIHIVLAHSAMTWGHDLWHFRPLNHLKLSKHVFLQENWK